MDTDLVALEVVVLEASIFAVGHEKAWLAETVVDRDAVAGLGVVFVFAFAAEGFEQLALGAENVDEVGAVADSGIDAAIGSDRDGGEAFESAGNGLGVGVFDFEDDLAFEVELDDALAFVVGPVEVFLSLFFADRQRVGADAVEADAFDELAIGSQNDDAAIRLGGNVDLARLVDGYAAVSGTDRVAVGELSPVGMCLVSVNAVAGVD